ncbi:MAG: hypothetical protein NZ704_04840 [Geminicoccaceae bacterium]|nr:hypothetical protein [Geminicoccaceae bacterium]
MRRIPIRGRVLLMLAGAVLAAPVGAEEDDPLRHFPEGPNRELVAHFCSACHSGRIVANQRMNRQRWDEALSWMTERHGMPPLEGEYREMFLDYLAQAFGEETAQQHRRLPFAAPPARRNPFAAN